MKVVHVCCTVVNCCALLYIWHKMLIVSSRCARECERSIQHNNTTLLLSFLFFCNFTTGPMGSNMFCRISQNCEQIFCLNFLHGQSGHPTLDVQGGFRQNLALWPPRSIVGVGVKHAHDSDHAECMRVWYLGLWVQKFSEYFRKFIPIF